MSDLTALPLRLSLLRDATYTIVSSDGTIQGTCFRAPVLDSTSPGTYLLTAGHSIISEYRSKNSVRIMDWHGRRYDAKVLACSITSDADVGLLYVDEYLGGPLKCSSVDMGGAVYIRGSPSGVNNRQATLRGWNFGVEDIAASHLADVVIQDIGVLESSQEEPKPQRSLAYAALKGLSGAPICALADSSDILVLGLIVRRNTAGIANRVHAVPAASVASFLAEQGYLLQQTRPVQAVTASNILTGRLIGRLLEIPGGLHQLWEDASELFYTGVPVDVVFQEALAAPGHYGFASELQLAKLKFLLARLMLKRGDKHAGLAHLRDVRSSMRHGRSTEHQQLAVLADIRLFMNSASTIDLKHRQNVFELQLGRFEDVPDVPDGDRAYEIASAIGTEAAEWTASPTFSDQDARVRPYFAKMLARHSALLRKYPGVLNDKQEIVNIFLNAMDLMWAYPETGDKAQADLLEVIALRGRLAASQRRNAIFYAQMMATEAVSARIRGDLGSGFVLLGLCGIALAKGNLNLSHEGVKSHVFYLEQNDDIASRFLKAVHSLGASRARQMLLATTTSISELERIAIDGALRRCELVERDFVGIANLFDVPEDLRKL